MDNKYYTPTLEEFHVGFEYEEYNQYRDEWCSLILTKEDLEDLGSFMYNFLESFESNNIRIKYLDKEDIESLGFKNIYLSKEHFVKEINDKTFLIHPFYNILKTERENLVRILEVNRESYVKEKVLFCGDIKNKSELKKVLKMIGVIE